MTIASILPRGKTQNVGELYIKVLEGMKKKNTKDNGEEATEGSRQVLGRVGKCPPLLEQNSRSDDGEGSEHNVINGSDNRGVKDVQSLVEVVHLNSNARGNR